jgi:hypothetical protein
MKTALFFIMLMVTVNAFAVVTYEDCLEDAKTFANHVHAVAPLPECADIVDAESGKSENISGVFRAYGKDHIIYVDKKDSDGNVIERSLLAGDQTELVEVQKVFLDTLARRIYVVQLKDSKNQLMVYNLDFIGNVTPLNVMKSDSLFLGVTSVKAEGTDKIEIINAQGSFLINADAENRTSRSIQKQLVITPK